MHLLKIVEHTWYVSETLMFFACAICQANFSHRTVEFSQFCWPEKSVHGVQDRGINKTI